MGNVTIVSIAAPVVDQIGYFEAWRLWFGGQEADPQARLWFMSVLWWGRAGKIAAFVGGATVLLDIIGPDRLRQLGRNRKALDAAEGAWTKVGGVAGSLGALIAVAIGSYEPGGAVPFALAILAFTIVGVIALRMYALRSFVNFVARTLDSPQPANIVRITAAVLLLVGFHFDLLAS